MTDTMLGPDLMAVYERIEKKTEREIFVALLLTMSAHMPNFSISEFFDLCVSGVDDDVWMPQDIPP